MRYFCKKALAAAALLLFFFAPRSIVFGQSNGHFEWAQGFGTAYSGYDGDYILGSVTDSLGNLYILGQFRNDSEWGTGWDAELLLPMTPYGPNSNTSNTIIAKISPDGEMVWKKVIHSNNGAANYPNDIKKVGDTAFACMVGVILPTEDHYTYYLDTLIPSRSDYPVNSMYVENPMRTAFIMFDFEGDVLEQHFLYLTYTDSTGNDIVNYYNYNIDTTPWFRGYNYSNPSFDIDVNGNIYISRFSNDRLDDSFNAQDGSIRGVKFWVDGRLAGICLNESKPKIWYPQIIKFSPHFDTLLACRYVVQKSSESVEYHETLDTRTIVDCNGNVYFKSLYNPAVRSVTDTIIIDSVQNLSFYVPVLNSIFSILVQFDSNLNAKWIITLEDSVVVESSTVGSLKSFYDISFDKDSNLLFLSAQTTRTSFTDTSSVFYILTYNGTPLSRLKNDVFFMSFKIDGLLPMLHSYGRVPSVMNYSVANSPSTGNLSCKNNRLFIQSQYVGGLRLPSGDIRFSNKYDRGLGITIFDYQGNLIGGCDYNTLSPNNRPGPIAIHDSTVYLSGRLCANATFGDIPFSLNGTSQKAYIAKYVDTSFMTPYVKPTVNITTAIGDKTTYIYPNPALDIINLNIGSEPILEVSAISISGIKTPLIFNGSYIEVGELQQGLYILETVTPTNKYHSKFIKL
ncbi:MAG: T9SS type A sorting domain-containing protein [Bacteroidales bacterium]|nr:T9SS type A sorting domain-containing protein [Bacteroidales bacterium]